MMTKLVCMFLLMAGSTAQAIAGQGCPYSSAIKYVDGYFQAAQQSLLWQSPKVEKRDFVDQFIGAIFTPGKEQARENGHLDKCVYRTGSGHVVALRLGKQDEVERMSLTSTLHWQLSSDPLGQEIYICQDSQPDNCAFTVQRTKR